MIKKLAGTCPPEELMSCFTMLAAGAVFDGILAAGFQSVGTAVITPDFMATCWRADWRSFFSPASGLTARKRGSGGVSPAGIPIEGNQATAH